MADVFPISLFPPTSWQWILAGTPVRGGQPIAGAPDFANASAGGWWQAIFNPGQMWNIDQIGAWEAIIAELQDGGSIELAKFTGQQPWPSGLTGPLSPVTHSDGTPFSDGSEYSSSAITATLSAAAYAPAYPTPATPPSQLSITMSVGGALTGKEWLSLRGTSGIVRAHKIKRILSSSTSAGVTTYIVTISPPCREDYAIGQEVNFDDPSATFRMSPESIGQAWPMLTPGYITQSVSLKLEEIPW